METGSTEQEAANTGNIQKEVSVKQDKDFQEIVKNLKCCSFIK